MLEDLAAQFKIKTQVCCFVEGIVTGSVCYSHNDT